MWRFPKKPLICMAKWLRTVVRSGEPLGKLSLLFRYGKNSGDLVHAEPPSHIVALRPTTKFFAKSFVFINNGAKEGLNKDNPPALGAGGLRFKSGRPDQNISRVFFSLLKAPFTPTPICGILADRRS